MTADALAGLPVSPGTAAGPVVRMGGVPALPPDAGPEPDAAAAGRRVADALAAVAADLTARAEAAGGTAAQVLEAQALIAADPALLDAVEGRLSAGRGAASALVLAFTEFRTALATAGPYFAERIADLDDIRDRAVAVLLGLPMPGVPQRDHPYVLVAEDLAPADTATLDPSRVLGIVTALGGPTSHTAILAKSLGIPAVVACAGAADLADGVRVVVDGSTGAVLVDPDDDTLAAVDRARAERARRLAVGGGPGRTRDGHPVALLVNIGGLRDVGAAAAVDSEGVGLFRTEFLYLDRAVEPTRQEQEHCYRGVFTAFAGRRVVIRTLDAGADKALPFLGAADEPNPALGIRGLRVARRRPGLLRDQLEAIAAAAQGTDAEVWVMAPMVSTAQEAAGFTELARGCGLPVVGVMIEVPAAALRARDLLAFADFASLGTNDLAQYAFAADRMSGELADLLDIWQPALLDLVATAAEAGRRAGRTIGVCGEAASDPLLAPVLVGLGVRTLSMAPGSVPEVRAALARRSLAECRDLAARAREATSGPAARAAVLAAG